MVYFSVSNMRMLDLYDKNMVGGGHYCFCLRCYCKKRIFQKIINASKWWPKTVKGKDPFVPNVKSIPQMNGHSNWKLNQTLPKVRNNIIVPLIQQSSQEIDMFPFYLLLLRKKPSIFQVWEKKRENKIWIKMPKNRNLAEVTSVDCNVNTISGTLKHRYLYT